MSEHHILLGLGGIGANTLTDGMASLSLVW
ncbi:sodium:proton antiporter [Pseudomonas sp. TCU-HL1]|nr:sodium:proton antiporter [Pseudomonas sp. TCU-HL1]